MDFRSIYLVGIRRITWSVKNKYIISTNEIFSLVKSDIFIRMNHITIKYGTCETGANCGMESSIS